VGDCAWTDQNTDIGMYCSILYEDRGFEAIYLIGLTFSEADTWVLLGQYEDGSWVVDRRDAALLRRRGRPVAATLVRVCDSDLIGL
jgi:hypothetical protein